MAEVIKVNDSTWRFEDDGVRFFLFAGTKKAALIDSGMNVPNAKKLAEELTDLPLILITYRQPVDTRLSQGLQVFPRRIARVHLHRHFFRFLQSYRPYDSLNVRCIQRTGCSASDIDGLYGLACLISPHCYLFEQRFHIFLTPR